MSSLRQSEAGQLTIRGTNVATPGGCLPGWMQECMDAQSGFLPPAPNSASPSPCGSPTWSVPIARRINSEGVAEPD
jgi:hypothetical protein